MLNNNLIKPSSSPASSYKAGRRDVDNNNRKSSRVTSDLHSVRNSTQLLSAQGKATTRHTNGFFSRLWNPLRVSGGCHAVENVKDQESTMLREILTKGGSLYRQAESQLTPVDEQPIPGAWNGSLLKRGLIGMGILAGTGVLGGIGYRCYVGREAPTAIEAARNSIGPMSSGTSVRPVAAQPGSGGILEDAFGNHTLPYHDDKKINSRHGRRHNLIVYAANEQTTLPHPDYVKIEKLNFSCIEERQHLSLADVFRQIGITFKNPINELAKESQVIHYYNKFGRCPTEEDIKKLEAITSRIDSIISGILILLPGSKPLYLTQSLGGPLFKLLGDYMDNREGDIEDDMKEIAEQSAFIAKIISEYAPLDSKGKVNDKDISLPKKMFFHHGKLSTEINGDKWGLSYEENRFVASKENEKRQVEYSREEEEWKLGRDIKELSAEKKLFGENVVYSIEKTEKIISELAVDAVGYEKINDVKYADYYRVKHSNGKEHLCIKISEKFLPVRSISSDIVSFEVYNVKRPGKTGYSIFVGSDNKFHFGNFLSPSMKYKTEFFSYASSDFHRSIPQSYYIKELDVVRSTPVDSRGVVKVPGGKQYIVLTGGYVEIKRHPLFPHVYEFGPSESDKVLGYYDKESNRFYSVPGERSVTGKRVNEMWSIIEEDFQEKNKKLEFEFEAQKKLSSYRNGFRTDIFDNYKLIKTVDIKVSARVERFYLYGLNDAEIIHAKKYREAALEIKKDILSAKTMIEKVRGNVLNPEHNSHVMKRLHEIFDIEPGTAEAQELTDLFIKNIDGTKRLIDEYIADDFRRIWLVKFKDNKIFGETWVNDPCRRMYLNLKETNAYKNKNTFRGRLNVKTSKGNDVPTIIHEASHQGADTEDFFYMYGMTLDEKISRLKAGEMSNKEIKILLKSDEAYRSPFSLKTDREYAQDLYNKNPNVRIDFLLNNADSFSAITSDLFSKATGISKRDTSSGKVPNTDMIYMFTTLYSQ